MRMTAWSDYEEMYPKMRTQTARALKIVAPKLVVKLEQPSFELFGVDFIFDGFRHPWMAEINRSPRQLDTDKPMLHAMLDLVMRERKTPPAMSAPFVWEQLRPNDLR